MKLDRSLFYVVGMVAVVAGLLGSTNAMASSYYINCSASSNGSGTSASPWNSLSSPNAQTFGAGDNIYFNRGTTCHGTFSPQGSGTSSSPIIVDAYGSGPIPIIDGGTNTAVMTLTNQSYWNINNLNLEYGEQYGLAVTASSNTAIYGIVVTNIIAQGAQYQSRSRDDSGEIYFTVDGSANATINDSGVSGAWAGGTTVSEGIVIAAGPWASMTSAKGNNIWVLNSIVQRVGGDGILIIDANNAQIQYSNVSYSGQCPSSFCGGSTPTGLWMWNSTNSVMAWNESYSNSSWGGDGGGYDIDYWNNNLIAEYNYGHDNLGYCVSVYGYDGEVTVNSIIRYNLCVNNDNQSGSIGVGEFYLFTGTGGSLNGVEIYNNTAYETTSLGGGLTDYASFTGSNPIFFENNIIYGANSSVWDFVNAYSPFTFSNNIYYSASGSTQYWEWNGVWYNTLASWQSASGSDSNSMTSDPQLGSPGWDGTAWPGTQYAPQSGSPAIGAGVNVCSGISGCSMGNFDIAGYSLPSSGLNIGAFQSTSALANLVDNPTFATGSESPWTTWIGTGSSSDVYVQTCASHTAPCYSGDTYWLAFYDSSNAYSVSAYQSVTLLSSGSSFTASVYAYTGPGASALIKVNDANGGTQLCSTSIPANNGAWTQYTCSGMVDSTGQVWLSLQSGNPNPANSWVVFDNASVTSSPSSNLLSNPTFTTGNESPWTTWVGTGSSSDVYVQTCTGHAAPCYSGDTYWLAFYDASNAYSVSAYQSVTGQTNGASFTASVYAYTGPSATGLITVKDGYSGSLLCSTSIPANNGAWTQYTCSGTVDSTGQLWVSLNSGNTNPANSWVVFDNASLTD